MSYSDASNVAWAGCMRVEEAELKAHGNWCLEERGPHTSSTWREIRAVHLLLCSASRFLSGKFVCHHTDNQNVDRILRNGSRVRQLQEEAVAIYALCVEHFIRLEVKWIPRELNTKADYLSKFICKDDFKLVGKVFHALDGLWGPHSVDWFASHLSTQLPRFFAQFWCPHCEGVDAFARSWDGENGWFFPPPFLVGRVLDHMVETAAVGTLVVPYWPSQRWWPRLAPNGHEPAWFVADWRDLVVENGLFLRCGQVDNCFTDGSLSSRVLAVRICCQRGGTVSCNRQSGNFNKSIFLEL